jgi:hypothetical protein
MPVFNRNLSIVFITPAFNFGFPIILSVFQRIALSAELPGAESGRVKKGSCPDPLDRVSF